MGVTIEIKKVKMKENPVRILKNAISTGEGGIIFTASKIHKVKERTNTIIPRIMVLVNE